MVFAESGLADCERTAAQPRSLFLNPFAQICIYRGKRNKGKGVGTERKGRNTGNHCARYVDTEIIYAKYSVSLYLAVIFTTCCFLYFFPIFYYSFSRNKSNIVEKLLEKIDFQKLRFFIIRRSKTECIIHTPNIRKLRMMGNIFDKCEKKIIFLHIFIYNHQ